MKIYTKKGDAGMTSLFGGTRLPKDHIRIDAYGTVDELNSYVGIVIDTCDLEEAKRDLILIQHWLFAYGALLATKPGGKVIIEDPGADSIGFLEKRIDAMEEELPDLKTFILPSGYLPTSHAHVARCICRRAERQIVALHHTEPVLEHIMTFFNRLSDYLFVLSRYLSFKHGVPDVPWLPDYKL